MYKKGDEAGWEGMGDWKGGGDRVREEMNNHTSRETIICIMDCM